VRIEELESRNMRSQGIDGRGREGRKTDEAVPIWLAVLLAASCQAKSDSRNHAIRWNRMSGRATYTNAGSEDEHIEPLGVRLSRGETLAVSWMPGDTEYTFEVYEQ